MQHPDMRVIREALQEVLSSSQTSAVLFAALDGHGGSIPQSGDELRALVQGPLREALEKQLGNERTEEILTTIESKLRLEEADMSGTRPRASYSQPPPPGREDEATTAVPTATDPVAVAVVASSESFARRLEAVLGSRRVAPFTVTGIDTLAGLGQGASLVLVDCTDFPPIDANALASALSALPGTTVRVVWGSNLPYGRSLIEALLLTDVPHTPIDRKEGLEPLLDLIRARQRAI